jgi:type IV pilus assembly protein PilX
MKNFNGRQGLASGSQKQTGASLLVVLVLLTVMLLGVVSMARVGETNALIAGNTASKDTSLQASEVGISDAFAAIRGLATPDTSDPSWYYASYSRANDNSSGLPKLVNWNSNALNKKIVGSPPAPTYTVRYVVERMCSVTPVTDAASQCMVKKAYASESAKAGVELLESTPGTQYRITVNVAGPKESSTFVQSLVVN